MKSLEQRIINLEKPKANQLKDLFYANVCKFAEYQGRRAPDRPRDLATAIEQLADFLPD